MSLCLVNEPPEIFDVQVLIDGDPVSLTNPPKPLSVVTIVADLYNPQGTTTYTFYIDGSGVEPAQVSDSSQFSIEDFNPSSTNPSNYPIPGTVLFCKITCINPIDVAEQIVEVGEVHGLLPDVTGTFLENVSLNITPNQVVSVGDFIQFTPKDTLLQSGNPDINNNITFFVNDQTLTEPWEYTVSGNETDCRVVVEKIEISNSDPEIQNTGTVEVVYNLEIAGVQGGACTDTLGSCCATGAYNPATGVTQGSCLSKTEEECAALNPPGFWSAGNCPDCSSDLSIGNPCCPEYPRGRCCRGSNNSTPCSDNILESDCQGNGEVWDFGRTCSECSSSDENAGYCGCLGACCDGTSCTDNVLLHQCNNSHFAGSNCSECDQSTDNEFIISCCPSGLVYNGFTVVYVEDQNPQPPGNNEDRRYKCIDLSFNPDTGEEHNFGPGIDVWNEMLDRSLADGPSNPGPFVSLGEPPIICKTPRRIRKSLSSAPCTISRKNDTIPGAANSRDCCLYRSSFAQTTSAGFGASNWSTGGRGWSDNAARACQFDTICGCFKENSMSCGLGFDVTSRITSDASWFIQIKNKPLARCLKKICDIDSFCCNTDWDGTCVAEAETYCCHPDRCGSDGVITDDDIVQPYDIDIYSYMYAFRNNSADCQNSTDEPCVRNADVIPLCYSKIMSNEVKTSFKSTKSKCASVGCVNEFGQPAEWAGMEVYWSDW